MTEEDETDQTPRHQTPRRREEFDVWDDAELWSVLLGLQVFLVHLLVLLRNLHF